MSRRTRNEYADGYLINGYDYENQAWVVDGKYVSCKHPEKMDCGCFGKRHEGQSTVTVAFSTIRKVVTT